MAALVKDDGSLVQTSFRVSAAGAKRYVEALERPKKPPEKLIAIMAIRKVFAKAK